MKYSNCQFLIGTSGWSYDEWRGVFYPEKLPKRAWFEYYTSRFACVEVNATFYRTFKDPVFLKWRDQVTDDFRYVLKVPRLITHRKYLIDTESSIKEFCRQSFLLENKLGLLLLQLPPNLPYDPERLRNALLLFDARKKVAVEFRNKKWFTEEIYQLLKELGCIFCAADSPATQLVDWLTSDCAYIRLHGRKHWFIDNYSNKELQEIARLAKQLAQAGAKKVYIFFNNTAHGYAPQNALRLMELLQ
jgi:uncharacterized protein YecE (DUF72 family)